MTSEQELLRRVELKKQLIFITQAEIRDLEAQLHKDCCIDEETLIFAEA